MTTGKAKHPEFHKCRHAPALEDYTAAEELFTPEPGENDEDAERRWCGYPSVVVQRNGAWFLSVRDEYVIPIEHCPFCGLWLPRNAALGAGDSMQMIIDRGRTVANGILLTPLWYGQPVLLLTLGKSMDSVPAGELLALPRMEDFHNFTRDADDCKIYFEDGRSASCLVTNRTDAERDRALQSSRARGIDLSAWIAESLGMPIPPCLPRGTATTTFEERGYEFGYGWYPYVAGILESMREIDPAVRIVQAKEKFGTLRIYLDSGAENEKRDELSHIGLVAQFGATRICEDCGRPGRLKKIDGLMKTVCPACAVKIEKRLAK